jgi:hypothetical protein
MDSSLSNGYINNGIEREVAPSFLFGERTHKRKAFALNGRPSGNFQLFGAHLIMTHFSFWIAGYSQKGSFRC